MCVEADHFSASHTLDDLDKIAADLRVLRDNAGQISYGEIATRIAVRRQAAGARPAAAQIARSTVHEMFIPGRRRMNASLLAEIVQALGESRETAQEWFHRCVAVQQQPNRAAVSARTGASTRRIVDSESEDPAAGYLLPPPKRSAALSEAFPFPLSDPRPYPRIVIAFILVACVGLNYFGNTLNSKFQLPFFLDMIGTATAAIALGPWYGALVGLTTNSLAAIGADPISLPFALVNVAGALVWGYGVRAWRMKRPWWRFMLLNLIVALVCTMVAVPINVLVFGGVAEGHAAANLVAVLVTSGEGLWQSVFSVNISISVVDKIFSGYFGLGLALLVSRWRLAPT